VSCRPPQAGHRALTLLERGDRIGVHFPELPEYRHDPAADHHTVGSGRLSVITQNVDGLHSRAGTAHVTDLHGRNDRLVCLACGQMHSRRAFHRQLEELNADLHAELRTRAHAAARLPDGDGETDPDEMYDGLRVPPCPRCGTGALKPDVVFFGDGVPPARADRCAAAVGAADGLLCVGTSLATYSSLRIVRAAAAAGVPVAVLNVGRTRAEEEGIEVTKVEAAAGDVLRLLAEKLVPHVEPAENLGTA